MKQTVLPNGVRSILTPIKNSKAVTILILVGAGSKYEDKRINGISHFLEHMYFKGTKKRPNPKMVAESIDKIGGEYNAFTGDEYTGYYAKVASHHFNLALDWVSDIFLNSKLPGKEIAKEKGVITEEINMIKDHPMSHLSEIWMKLLYGDQPAGRSIAGTKETVSGITRKDLIDYMEKSYTSDNTIISIAGSIDEKKTKKLVADYFSRVKKRGKPIKEGVIENQKEPAFVLEKRKTDQAHISLGVRSYNLFHVDRYVLNVIETILGKMMSSRLFIKIREELGLAYYIKTDVDLTTDTGFLTTKAGVDINKIEKAIKAIVEEYKKISKIKVSESELKKAKENIKGRAALGLESSDSQAIFYATQGLLQEEILTPSEIFKKIDQVSAQDVLRVSKDIFKPEKINLAVLGPIDKKRELKKLLTF